MASKNTDNSSAGDILLIKELSPYLGYTRAQLKWALEEAKHGGMAVESLLERAISIQGKIKRSNKDGEDFIDGSDAKKVTLSRNSKSDNSLSCHISNLKNKKGILRVAVSDPFRNKVHYFKIPHSLYVGRKTINLSFSHKSLDGMPNIKEKTNSKSFSAMVWQYYKCDSFEELCRPVKWK